MNVKVQKSSTNFIAEAYPDVKVFGEHLLGLVVDRDVAGIAQCCALDVGDGS